MKKKKINMLHPPLDGLHLLIREQCFLLCGCLLFSERSCLKQGQGSAPGVTVPRPRVEKVCLRGSSLCREPHRLALQMDSLSEFPALRSEPERGVGMFIMPENGI